MRELERELRALRIEDVFPPTPDQAPAVAARLEQPSPARPARPWRLLRAYSAFALVLALLVAAAITLSASPSARSAILDFLGLEGANIERGTPVTTRTAPLQLGERVTLAQARRRAGFEPVLPDLAALGVPRAVAFDRDVAPGGQVSLLWGGGRTALVFTQLRGSAEPVIEKVAGAGTRVEPVRVEGEPGYWLAGSPHQFAFTTPDGQIRMETLRLAGPTLLWQRDGLLLRLEGAASKSRALAIARSIP